MIQTTLGALVQAEPVLARLRELRVGVKLAYHLMKLCALVQVETAHHERERAAWIRELGTATDNGVSVTPADPQWDVFVTRMTDLAALPVELAWRPLTINALAGIDLSATELAALGALVAPDGDGTDTPLGPG